MEKVSLYIPCYNADRYLARCLEGALRQDHPPAEIIVVDDGSVDGSLEIASRYPVRIVRHERNRGLAAARNTGVRASRCGLVAAIDADCIPRPDWLGKMLEAFENCGAAGVGGRLEELNRATLPDLWRTLHMVQHHGARMLPRTRFIWGHSTLFRKSALESVGLYQEALRTNAEDSYICRKLHAAGFALAYQPEAVVDHLRVDTLASVMDNFRRWTFYGYRLDVTLLNTIRSIGNYTVGLFPRFLLQDLRARRADCAALTCRVIAENVMADLRCYMRDKGKRRLFDA
jgi:cellulose synthase/poly-beta-1,6-N-acetylglucosamine synthase-like glycosyltransferase